jgi:hypothetical protein
MLTTLPSLLAVALTLGAGDLGSRLEDPVLAVLAEDEAMDFDLFGDTESVPREAIDPSVGARAQTRRSMLQTHQILGLSTLTLMTTTAVIGQINYMDLYGRGGARSGDYLLAHRIASYTTAGVFLSTAVFALFAPAPYERRGGFDNAMLHRLAVIGASAGLVTQVVLGFVTARSADAGNARNVETFATIHQAVGYTTLGLMTVAATVWLF